MLGCPGASWAQGLVISEAMAENRSTVADEDGEFPDWVELFNNGVESVLLSDHSLSDSSANPGKWPLPSRILAPGESLVVFCSGKDRPGLEPSSTPSSFEPRSVSGLQVWYDGMDQSSLVLDGLQVAVWLDKSEAGNHAGQERPDLRPLYGLHVPRLLGTVHFDGRDDFLRIPDLNQIRSVFWVGFEHAFASDNFRPILGHDRHFDFHRGGNRSMFAFKHTVPIQQGRTRVDGVEVNPWTTPVPNGLSLVEITSSSPLRANLVGSDRLLVDRVWHGGMAELLVFDRVLTPSEQNDVRSYLMQKWQLPTRFPHSNFRLRGGSETAFLYDRGNNLVDAVALPALKADVSIGRTNDRNGGLGIFADPTPGWPNGANAFQGALAAPELSVPAGAYSGPVSLTVTESPAEAVVRYTTDGSLPSVESPTFPSVLTLQETTTLRVASFREGFLESDVTTQSYLISDASTIPRVMLTSAPENLYSSDDGIYIRGAGASLHLPHFGSNFWRDWERPVFVEFFEAGGELRISQAAGLKIHGGWSRAAPQKSLALIARNRYGDSRFRFPVFESKSIGAFKQWLLRNSGNDWVRTLFRDGLGHQIVSSIGLDCQAYRPVHVFLNGQYWGIHNLRERLNEHFISANHGIGLDTFDFLEGERSVISGEVAAFDTFLSYLRDTDPKSHSFGTGVEALMDVDQFFDYIAAQVYIDNTDWPGNNIRYWKSRGPEGRWRWIPFDLDGGFDIKHTGAGRNLLSDLLGTRNQSFGPSWIRYIIQRLLQNPEFESRFVTRFQDLLNSTFSTAEVLSRVSDLEANLAPEIPRHVARWGGSESLDFISFESEPQWREYVDVIKAFAVLRPAIVRNHLTVAFRLGAFHGIEVKVSDSSQGSVRLNGMALEGTGGLWQGQYSEGTRVRIEAIPAPGYRFAGWGDDAGAQADREIVLSERISLEPLFVIDPALGNPGVPGHVLADRPFVFQSFFAESAERADLESLAFFGREAIDVPLSGGRLIPWGHGFEFSGGSQFRPMGGEGVSFLNDASGGSNREPRYVDSIVVAVDTRGVNAGTLSWTAASLSPGDRGMGLGIQYRVGGEGDFVKFAHVPEGEGLFSPAGRAGVVRRFENLALPLEVLDQPRVEFRWVYYQVDQDAAGPRRAEIRLDDVVIAARGQSPEILDGEVVINELMYHPISRDPRDEYIELYNRGTVPVNLSGWRLGGGVDYEFGEVILEANGYVVIAADRARFGERFPEIDRVFGNWSGRLSNQSETVRLWNARGERVDRVTYADEGDWNVRIRGDLDRGHQGWTWSDAHDGGGHSLELIASGLSNNQGMNWAASREPWGTPGQSNSVAVVNSAPLLSDPSHFPIVPRSDDTVTIRVRVRDEQLDAVGVALFYRVGNEGDFISTRMWDDGQHGDEGRRDGVFAAQVPPQANGTVVSFYIEASDVAGELNRWPRFQSQSIGTAPLAMYQVEDQRLGGDGPILRVITSELERAELDRIGQLPWNESSDAEMNATFISRQGAEIEVHYLVGLRIRGSTSRALTPKNRRVNFRSDEPWKGKGAVILNAVNVPSQIVGSLVFRMAGVPAAAARPVRFLENGRNHANDGAGQFGHYAELEVLDGDFVRRQFPENSGGNLYRPSGNGNLEFLGEDPVAYQRPGFYRKGTNVERNDWSDLIELTRRLEQSSDDQYVSALEPLVDIDRWVSYFAVDTLLANTETSFANGGAGDYALFVNEADRRSYLIAYDLDSLWAAHARGRDLGLFRAGANSVANRFLKHPEIAKRYHQRLRELVSTVFHPAILGPSLDQALGAWVSEGEIERLKSFALERSTFVLGESQVPFSVDVTLPFADPAWLRYYLEPSGNLSLSGKFDPLLLDRLEVNGLPATLETWSGQWSLAGIPLHPGVNPISIRGGSEGQSDTLRLLNVFRPGEGHTITMTDLSEDTLWRADQSPIVVNQTLRVPKGVTLTIEAGTSVEFNQGAGLLVEGRLLAQGTPDKRILLSRNRHETIRWGGLQFNGAQQTNELHAVTLEWPISPGVTAIESTLSMINLRWSGAFDSYLHTRHSSVLLKDSVLPNAVGGELITGFGVPEGGFWVLEGNEFGSTNGGGDIVDFSGGQRPDRMLQILDNVFHGGPDDGLDLDGAAAFVDGNVFMNFKKANRGTGDAHAISTGFYEGRVSDLTVIRNLFVDNEHALLMKEGAVALVENNTFIRSILGTVNFTEIERGTRAPDSLIVRRSIVWDSPLFRHLEIAQSKNPNLEPVFENSLVFPPADGVPDGNLQLDPLFVNPLDDFRLSPDSPAIGAGVNGGDLGAFIGAGLRIRGEPALLTSRRNAVLTVTGTAMTHFRYRVNDDEFGPSQSIAQPIVLTDLGVGPYQVSVIGRNVAGRWQEESEASVSQTWFVNPALPSIRLNEVLASNVGAHEVSERFPDYIEFYNEGDRPYDLSRMQLSDDLAVPNKFVFPQGTILNAGEYLIVYADRALASDESGLHAPFQVARGGDGIYLRSRFSAGGELIDSIQFGRQLDDFSLSRSPRGTWTLGSPTPAAANKLVALGQSDDVTINEWLAAPVGGGADFIELYNTSQKPVNIGGLALSPEPTLAWRATPIRAFSFLNGHEFLAFYSDNGEPGEGEALGFRLSKEQGMIGLLDVQGEVLDQFAFAYQRPGVSLEQVPPGSGNVQANPNPSPGAAITSVPTMPLLVLNEIVADNRIDPGSESTFPDWVELYNPTAEPISLAGYTLTDDETRPNRWAFPEDAEIGPQAYWVVHFDSSRAADAGNTGFGLKSDGAAVFLLGPSDGALVVVDQIQYGLQAPGGSLGRRPDLSSWTLCEPTPGDTNRPVPLGAVENLRINEWMAQPERGSDWFEIYNDGDLPVSLEGLMITDDPTRIDRHVIPPHSYLGVGLFGYQVFEADGEPDRGGVHVDFKLSAGGESIGLYSADGTRIDEIRFGAQQRGVSEGRLPDGGDEVASFSDYVTRGHANFVDQDLDGMLDSWERAVGLDPQVRSDGLDDPDGDGILNFGEYLAGTDPFDSESRFMIRQIEIDPDTSMFRIGFTGERGQAYRIEVSQDLASGTWQELRSIKRLARRVELRINAGQLDGNAYFRVLTP